MEIKVLDFTGKWCSTCIVLDKILKSDVIPRYKNKIKFIKVDDINDLTKQYEVLSIPTLIILKDGKEIWRKSGSIIKEDAIKELDKAIK